MSICEQCTQEFKPKRNTVGKFCSYECYWATKRGVYPPHIDREAQRKAHGCIDCGKTFQCSQQSTKRCRTCNGKNRQAILAGENADGGSKQYQLAREKDRRSVEYRAWRLAVLERDEYTCQRCFAPAVIADHILRYRLYPELRYEISNGQALCKPCHHTKTGSEIREAYALAREGN